MLPKAVRLCLFLERLSAAEPASNRDGALELLAMVLGEVEDAHSGVPADPVTWRSDGRMYSPQSDAARPYGDLPGVTGYRSVAHRTLVAENGALAIIDLGTGIVLIEKAGRDGKGLPPAKK